MKYFLFLGISKIHLVHGDAAQHRHQFESFRTVHVTVLLILTHGDTVWNLPCPVTGPLRAFGHSAVFFRHIYQCYRSVILFRLFIQQLKDTVGTGHGHDHRVKLVGNLGNRVDEVSGQGQEGCDGPQGQYRFPADGQICNTGDAHNTADDRNCHIKNVAQIAHNRHQDVGHGIGIGGCTAQFQVFLIKIRLGLLFMAEDFYDLLAVDHFFDIAVQFAQVFLLLHEEAAALSCDFAGKEDHKHSESHNHQSQPYRQVQHGNQHRNHGYNGTEQVWQRLGQHLTQGICVVGVMAHDLAVGSRIKISHRQVLHVGKHFVTDIFQRTLRHNRHCDCRKEIGKDSRCENNAHISHGVKQPIKLWICLSQQGQNVVVNQTLDKQGGCHAGNCTDQNADNHKQQTELIVCQVGEQPFNGSFFNFCSRWDSHTAAPSRSSHWSWSCHYAAPPSPKVVLFCDS